MHLIDEVRATCVMRKMRVVRTRRGARLADGVLQVLHQAAQLLGLLLLHVPHEHGE